MLGDRSETHLAVGNAALGDHGLRKLSDDLCVAAQHRHFKTALGIEVNMHRRDLQIVVGMVRVGEALGQFANMMIVNVG